MGTTESETEAAEIDSELTKPPGRKAHSITGLTTYSVQWPVPCMPLPRASRAQSFAIHTVMCHRAAQSNLPPTGHVLVAAQAH